MTRATVTRERIRPHDAAAITGLRIRTVQAMAARGEIPGAAKLGGSWTFDEAALRNWIKERTTCPKDRRRQSTHTGEGIRYGRALPLADVNIERAYEQAMSKLLGRA